MHVVFRTDASLQIGTGHVMRCLTLADSLRKQGAECQFVCRAHDGNLLDHIRSCNYEAHALPNTGNHTTFNSDLLHASWLGVDWLTDAQQTCHVLAHKKYDWLIVDHYALDHRWEATLHSYFKHIMVIDDFADRRHICDLLLDQNYGSSAERYADLVSTDCMQLHGPKFALLKPIYAQLRAEQSVRSGVIERVLVYFGGGTDPIDLTGMALRAFQAPELKGIDLDIVVGSGYPRREQLQSAAAIRGRTCIHTHLPDLSGLMAKADLAVGSAGATTWERCCLGLPSILVISAINQSVIGKSMQALGAALVSRPNTNFSLDLKNNVLGMFEDTASYLKMSNAAWQICDGLGVQRTVGLIKEFH